MRCVLRRPTDTREPLPASEFNRATTGDGASQLMVDLGAAGAEHNEIVVSLDGQNYRRHAVLEGSADAEKWETLLDTQIVFFQQSGKEFDGRTLTYPRSRFRYLRLQVYPDSEVDRMPPAIQSVVVRRTVTLPGEFAALPATIEPREPTRGNGGPASAWILDLGVSHVPCEKLTVEVADADFARDYAVEAGGSEGSDETFASVTNGQWARSGGGRQTPLNADFAEHAPGRLRLVVTDFRNPPLDLKSAQFSCPARQVVFARDPELKSPLRLYYGNHTAEAPHYDLETATCPRASIRRLRGLSYKSNRKTRILSPNESHSPKLAVVDLRGVGAASGVLGLVLLDLVVPSWPGMIGQWLVISGWCRQGRGLGSWMDCSRIAGICFNSMGKIEPAKHRMVALTALSHRCLTCLD